MIFFLSLLLSAIFVYLIIKYQIGLDKRMGEKSHALHTHQVSRLGGLGIIGAIAIASLFYSQPFMIVLIAGVAIFTFGFIEDRFHVDLPYVYKISFLALSSLILLYLTKEGVFNLGFIDFRNSEILKIIGFCIAFIGIVGFASAVNFVDGLNGYAMGVVFVTLLFFGIYFYEEHMSQFLTMTLILEGAILGFLIFNFPFGKVFLGDMGAHLIGFIVAYISIAMTNHSAISVWYPFAAFALPVIETLKTMQRRIKRKRLGISFDQSDNDHLHHLVYFYIQKRFSSIKDSRLLNSLATLYILTFHILLNIAAFSFRENIVVLIGLFLLATFTYIWFYNRLSRLRSETV